MHFTPTSGSWLNLVEVWFGIIERQAIRRGTFRSVKDLNAKIRAFIDNWNDERAHPFAWTKTAERIVRRWVSGQMRRPPSARTLAWPRASSQSRRRTGPGSGGVLPALSARSARVWGHGRRDRSYADRIGLYLTGRARCACRPEQRNFTTPLRFSIKLRLGGQTRFGRRSDERTSA